MKYIFSIVIITLISSSLHALPWSENTDHKAFLEAVQILNNGKPKDALDIFMQLKDRNYDKDNALLLFTIGRALREIGKKDKDPSILYKSRIYFHKYCDDPSTSKDDKVIAQVYIAYLMLDMGEYSEGIKIIDTLEYTTDKKYILDAARCSAYLHNAEGYRLYRNDMHQEALAHFRKAHSDMETCKLVPSSDSALIANNLIDTALEVIYSTKKGERINLINEMESLCNKYANTINEYPKLNNTCRRVAHARERYVTSGQK